MYIQFSCPYTCHIPVYLKNVCLYFQPLRHVALQTDVIIPPPKQLCTCGTQTDVTQITRDEDLNESFTTVGSLNESFNSINDPTWHPNDLHESFDNDDNDVTPDKERKFIVFESNLDRLIERPCINCGRMLREFNKKTQGTGLYVSGRCACGYIFSWDSQPSSGTMPLGNLLLAGAILFSGSSPAQSLRMLRHLTVQSISERTYYLIQQLYLVPTVQEVYSIKRDELINDITIRDVPVKLGGDGRCCSPGHTAKFCSYSVMDLTTNKILDVKLVQVWFWEFRKNV